MTENEAKIQELKDAVCELVSISEDNSRSEDFKRLDSAGVKLIGCLEELEAYRAIGTIEEFKALKEKSEPKKLLDDGMRIPFSYYCPNCKAELSDDGHKYDDDYCPNCGQAIEQE